MCWSVTDPRILVVGTVGLFFVSVYLEQACRRSIVLAWTLDFLETDLEPHQCGHTVHLAVVAVEHMGSFGLVVVAIEHIGSVDIVTVVAVEHMDSLVVVTVVTVPKPDLDLGSPLALASRRSSATPARPLWPPKGQEAP